MSEASFRRRQHRSSNRGLPAGGSPVRTSRSRRPHDQQRHRKKSACKVQVLPRCSSEPLLWIVQLVPDDDDVVLESDKEEDAPLFIDPTFYSCCDVLEPSQKVQALPCRLLDPSEEEKKVLLTVTVEGSVGPVRAMVRLGASVEEAIRAVLQRYKSEGRSPRLDTAVPASFQLHYSHFSLQSLNKDDKIGEVGGRSFYLRKDCEVAGSLPGTASNLVIHQNTDVLSGLKTQAINTSQLFMSFIVKKLNKIKRRSIRLWRFITCS